MSFFEDWFELAPELLGGLLVSLQLCLTALALGLPLGILLAIGSSAPRAIIRRTIIVFVEVGRGAPALIILYLVYFGLPQFQLVLSSFVSAVIALAIIVGAYTAEIFRAGINAIPRGQREASRALGLSWRKELQLVILPQAIRIVIAPLVGFAILAFQASSLAFAVSVPELLSVAYNTASITYRFWPALTLAGLMYAVVTLLAVWLLSLSSRKRTRTKLTSPSLRNPRNALLP